MKNINKQEITPKYRVGQKVITINKVGTLHLIYRTIVCILVSIGSDTKYSYQFRNGDTLEQDRIFENKEEIIKTILDRVVNDSEDRAWG